MNAADDKLERIVRRIVDLKPLPQVAQRALMLINDSNKGLAEVAQVLTMDEALASMVLRWANSAYFGLARPVGTVQQAVVYLGESAVQSLVLTASMSSYFDQPMPGYGLDRGDLWRHAVGVAAGSKALLRGYQRSMAEEAYHAGLMCDIGKLAMDSLLREMNVPLERLKGVAFQDIEKSYFGVDHATLGGYMARRWKLPESLVTAIAYHHRPSGTREHLVITSAVHVADAAVMMMGIGVGKDGLRYPLDPVAFDTLGFREENLSSLFQLISAFLEKTELTVGV
jgi:HD-like signal output (HDOD) protein